MRVMTIAVGVVKFIAKSLPPCLFMLYRRPTKHRAQSLFGLLLHSIYSYATRVMSTLRPEVGLQSFCACVDTGPICALEFSDCFGNVSVSLCFDVFAVTIVSELSGLNAVHS
jgi:hypothetical protein